MTDADARRAVAETLATIAPEADLDGCDTAAPFTRELDLDSMDVLSLLAGLGDRLGVEIPDSALDPGWSLDDLVGLLLRSAI